MMVKTVYGFWSTNAMLGLLGTGMLLYREQIVKGRNNEDRKPYLFDPSLMQAETKEDEQGRELVELGCFQIQSITLSRKYDSLTH